MSIAIIFALYLAIGAVAGIVAGLFGLGGGVVIVPALLFSFAYTGVDPAVATHLAIGTSLGTIVVTSLNAIYTHHRRGAVRWALVARITPGILLGAWLGAGLAASLPGEVLKAVFGVFLLVVALNMAFALKPNGRAELPGGAGLLAVGSGIGAVSALFGIGGGTLSVPFLSWCRVQMQQAVATSAAIGLPIALGGVAGYLWNGWGLAQLPPWSSGYVYWPALLGIVLASAPCARIGAVLAHRLPARKLQILFAGVIGLIGLRFLL